MTLYGLPVLYTLFAWWFSTGAILYLDGLPQRTFRFSMAGATLVMGAAVCGLIATGADTSVGGAYMGFSVGLVLWGWLEMGYYMGFMVGPRRVAAPEGSRGLARFGQAVMTTLYHELGALALTALIGAVTWDMPNKVALWTFLVLWGMQISAKLNVFLGVPNLAENFLPDHLAFLRSFMTRKPMNLFFPVSVTVSVVATTLLVERAASTPVAFEVVGATILSTLMVLAVLEHWFLVVPLPVEALWRWSLASRQSEREGSGAAPHPSEALSQRGAKRGLWVELFGSPAPTPSILSSIARRRQ